MNLGLSLLVIYSIGKLLTVAFHGFEVRLATIAVLLWQDMLSAALLVLVFRWSRRAAWILYAIGVLHFAISMPLLRLMTTPLTVPLLNAGSGTLADSISHHVDLVNLGLIAGTLFLGGVFPFLFRRLGERIPPVLYAPAALCVLAGFLLTRSSDLQGLHRNSVFAFMRSLSHSAEAALASSAVQPKHTPSSRHGALKGANILLIGLESTGTKHLSTYGARTDPMPFLSQLGREGIAFENVYAPYPESIKGLAALLFSRQPHFGFDPEDVAPDFGASLASQLARAGYGAALFHSGRFMYLGMDNVLAAAGFHRADDAGAIGGNHNSSFGVDDFSTVEHLLKWLDARTNSNPFFLHYLPISGHHPYEVPVRGPFAGPDDERRYLNALHYSDLALKKLVDGLRERVLLDTTLVAIYGDHGEAFGEHPGNYGHTLFLYEENVRVPLIFWMPAKLEPERINSLASLIDVAPTVCDLLGVLSPGCFEGASIFHAMDRPAFFSTEYSMRLRGVRFREWKLILEDDTGYTRLYHLERDPSEQTNLAGAHPEIARRLRRFFEWSDPAVPSTVMPDPETLAHR
jgi:hypothetical protein